MSQQKKLQQRRVRRCFRTRNSFASKGIKPRVTVFRSLKQIYAQIIDDAAGTTLVSFSSLQIKDGKGKDKKDTANLVGKKLGAAAVEKGISDVFFDRGRFPYHGRVQSLVEGLRESGLKL